MNPGLFLMVLRARFGLFALAVCATLVATAVVSLLLPKSYRATASLVVDRRDSQSLNDALNAFTSPLDRTGYLQTQVDIMKSPKVARRVVTTLKLDERPSNRARFAEARPASGSIQDWLASELTRNMDVETTQSSVMRVSYNADNAADAALIANGYARAYLDTTLDLRVEPNRQAAAWFDEQLKTLRKDLASAQERLTAYQQEHGIVSTDDRLDDEYTRLADLSGQLSRSQEQNMELRTRERQVQSALDQGRSLQSLPEIQNDSQIRSLRAELLKGEAALQILATKYGENHPDYIKQRADNRVIQQTISAEMRNIAATTTNQRHEGEQRTAEIAAALAAQRTRLLGLKESRDGLAVLLRDVNTAQSAYDTATQRFVATRVESRASQTNASVLDPAVEPAGPYRPSLSLNLALAAVIGTLLGLGLVMTKEMTDRRVHSAVELAHAVNAPVLGELIAWSPPASKLMLPAPRETGQMASRDQAHQS
jgi:chain length determinant protein EpsF